jgi:hypothetical protein
MVILTELLAADYPPDVAMAAVDQTCEQIEDALCALRKLGIDTSAIATIGIVANALERTRREE